MGYRGKEGFFPNFLKHGYFSEKRTPRTEKLDTIKEIFDEDTPNIQDVVDLSEGFTLSPITIFRRLLAKEEIKKADGGFPVTIRGDTVSFCSSKTFTCSSF